MAEPPSQQRQLPRPPQTGTTLPFIWPPPQHLQTPPPFQEPVLPSPPPESLIAKEMELDALRCEEPSNRQVKQVYDSLKQPPGADSSYSRARGATADQDMPRWYTLAGPHDDTLLFESRFESGNLRSAERIDESEYNLQLAFDINTDKHTQWFYFGVSNLLQGRPYKLNMQNLMKSEAVYNVGMQPLAYSKARAEQEGVGWYRTGSHACYFKNQLTRAGQKPFWTLTFTVQTSFEQDTLYLAHCFPYRYSDLQRYLSEMEASPLGQSSVIRRRRLCETLAGNDCDLLTITSPGGDNANKKGIIISARVHPGETNASWMMKGVLDYLRSDCHCAVALRDKFIFKIVPMLNPDGVIVGNYRCSLAGADLNRQYDDPKRELFPEVVHFKQMVSNFCIGREVMLYVDLHGHSKMSNIFMYGVENPTDETLYMRERVIPSLLDQATPLFNLADCTFDIGKGKEGCGRVVMRQQLGIVNAYTMEASFMGADQGEFEGIHFNQGHFEAMGHSLCEVLLDLVDPDQTKVEGIVRQFRERFPIDLSRVISKRDDHGGHGGSGNNSTSSSSDESDTTRHHHRHDRQVGRPSLSKHGTPTRRDTVVDIAGTMLLASKSAKGSTLGTPRPGSAPACSAGNNGESSGDEDTGEPPRNAKGNAESGAEKLNPATATAINPASASPTSATALIRPDSRNGKKSAATKVTKATAPGTSAKSSSAGTGDASAKKSSSKSGGSKPGTPKAAAGRGKASDGGKGKGVGSRPLSAKGGVARVSSSVRSTLSSSPRGVAVETAVRGESPKLRKKKASGGSAGESKHSKAAAMPPLIHPRGGGVAAAASASNSNSINTIVNTSGGRNAARAVSSAGKKTKVKGVPPAGSTNSARRPASSPASRSISSPRLRAPAGSDPPKRPPSAPPKTTGSRRSKAGSAASTRGVGTAKGKVKGATGNGGGGGGKAGLLVEKVEKK